MFFRYDQEHGSRFEFTRYLRGGPKVEFPRWQYDPELGVTLTILVEADTAAAANAIAERIGISFEPERVPEAWGSDYMHERFKTEPPQMWRWVPVTDDEHGFEEEAEALGDSDEYVLFNPWEVDPDFLGWPVFVHYANGEFCGWNPFVLWRSEYDSRPVE